MPAARECGAGAVDSAPAQTWRVLSHGPDTGARNMALDEAVARAVEARQVLPTIRFYAWAAPTVSLGWLQAAQGAVEHATCGQRHVGVVRRPTGGRAVLHDDELTYCVCVPRDGRWGRVSVGDSFRLIGEGLVAGLRRLGIAAELGQANAVHRGPGHGEACFQLPRMPAVLVAGKKLVGSAQRRWDGAILQHGSLLLDADLEMHQAIFPGWPRDEPGACMTSLRSLLRKVPPRAELERALVEGWVEVLGITGVAGELTPREGHTAEHLVATQYGRVSWTWRR
jgi:lipoyl(octanoyl) transferase